MQCSWLFDILSEVKKKWKLESPNIYNKNELLSIPEITEIALQTL